MSSVSLDISSGVFGQPELLPVIETTDDKVQKVLIYSSGFLVVSTLTSLVASKMGFIEIFKPIIIDSPLATMSTIAAVVGSLFIATVFTPCEHSLLKHGCFGLLAVARGLVFSWAAKFHPGAFVLGRVGVLALVGGFRALTMNVQKNRPKYEGFIAVKMATTALLCCYAPLPLPETSLRIVKYVGSVGFAATLIVFNAVSARRDTSSSRFDPIKHSMKEDPVTHLFIWIIETVVRKCNESYQSLIDNRTSLRKS